MFTLGLLASLFGAGAALVSSSMARKEQHNNLQMSLNAQKAENEKAREYNLMLADRVNQQNIEQWGRENAALKESIADERAYNDPSAQMARLQSAGLNPDMYYGNGSLVNTSSAYGVANSPSLTPGASANPMDWSALAGRKTIGETINESLQNRLLEAQIKNVEADSNLKNSNTGLNQIESQFRAQALQGQIEESSLRIRLGDTQIRSIERMDNQNIKESEARIKDLNQKAQESIARIQQIANSIKNDNARLNIEKQISKSQIDKMASECELNYTQAYQINRLVESVARQYDDAHEVHLENIGMLRINKGVLEFDAASKTSTDWWLDDRNWLQNILRYVDLLTDSLDGVLTPAAVLGSAAISKK